jgi:hypothetical protein
MDGEALSQYILGFLLWKMAFGRNNIILPCSGSGIRK